MKQNKINHRGVYSAASKYRSMVVSEREENNKDVKVQKFDVAKGSKKNLQHQMGLGLPQIKSVQIKKISQGIAENSGKKQDTKRDKAPQDFTDVQAKKGVHSTMLKTIFSKQEEPLPEKIKSFKSTRENKGRSIASLYLNLFEQQKKIEPKGRYNPSIQERLRSRRKYRQDGKGRKVDGGDGDGYGKQCLKNSANKYQTNSVNTKEMMLNGAGLGGRRQGQSKGLGVIVVVGGGHQSKENNKQQRKIQKVESGLQMIRKNKLKTAGELITRGEFDKASRVLNLLLQVDESDVQVMYMLARVSQKQGKLQVSKKYFRLMVLTESGCFRFDHEVLKLRALFQLGRYREVIGKIQSIEADHQTQLLAANKVQILKIKGHALVKISLMESALECFEEVLQIVDTQGLSIQRFDVYRNIGEIYFHFKMYRRALRYFRLHVQLGRHQWKQVDEKIVQKVRACKQNIMEELRLKQASSIENDKTQSPLKKQPFVDTNKNIIMNQNNKSHFQDQVEMSDSTKLCDHIPFSIDKPDAQKQPLKAAELADTLQKIEQRAKIHYRKGQYDKCSDTFEEYVHLSDLLKEYNSSSQISEGLNFYLSKIRQLDMNGVVEQDQSEISRRRNFNIAQAMRLFDSRSFEESISGIRALSVIGQESSVVRGSSILFQQVVSEDIFSLRQLRRVFKVWDEDKFLLQSMDEIAAITYDLVENDKEDFSILPLHVIGFTMGMKNQYSFGEINTLIVNKIEQLCRRYPASQKQVTESELRGFEIEWRDRERVDLFQGEGRFEDYRAIYKKIKEVAKQAQRQKEVMDQVCREICQKNNGVGYRSGLKLAVDGGEENERVYGRIVEKILARELRQRQGEFFARVKFDKEVDVKQLFAQMGREWQSVVDDILREKFQNQESVCCYVYDMMRAKCMFGSISEIDTATEDLLQGDKEGRYRIIEIDNRLDRKTKDVVLKIQFGKVVGELQLAVEFQSQRNQFNHGLYELARSPFGVVFAAFMWLAGFAVVDPTRRLIVNQKLKWEMKRLGNFRKFVYEDSLRIDFECQRIKQVIKRQFQCDNLLLDDFVMRVDSIEGYLQTEDGKYVDLWSDEVEENPQMMVGSMGSLPIDTFSRGDTQQMIRLKLVDYKPRQRFRFVFGEEKGTFADLRQFVGMRVYLKGTGYFLSLDGDGTQQSEFVVMKCGDKNSRMSKQEDVGSKGMKAWRQFRVGFVGRKCQKSDKQWMLSDRNYDQQIKEMIDIQRRLLQKVRKGFQSYELE